MLDFFRSGIKVVVLIALSHQDGLILEICFLQFGASVSDLFTQGNIAESGHHLTFLDILSGIFYGEHNNLFCNTAIDRNQAHCLYLTLDGS